MTTSLSENQKKIIIDALGAGAGKTADYLAKISQDSWKCTVSSIYHEATNSLFLTFPKSEKNYWSSFLPLQDNVPLGVQMLISSESLESISQAWGKIYKQSGKESSLSPQDMVKEISNIVAHGFCGKLGEIFSTLLILLVPDISKGTRQQLVEEGLKKIAGADTIVASNIILSRPDISVHCELYFYAEARTLSLFLNSAEKKKATN